MCRGILSDVLMWLIDGHFSGTLCLDLLFPVYISLF